MSPQGVRPTTPVAIDLAAAVLVAIELEAIVVDALAEGQYHSIPLSSSAPAVTESV